MRSFFKKMYIFLFEPRKIGVFLGEKMYKSILRLLLLALVAITPLIVSYAVKTEISSTSKNALAKFLMVEISETDFVIENGSFSGNDWEGVLIDECVIILNPNNMPISLSSEYMIYHIVEFSSNGMSVSLLNNTMYAKTYQDLGVDKIDFSKIEKADYIEFDKFLKLVNIAFNEFKVNWIIENTLFNYVFVIFNVFFTALVLAFIIKLVNPIVAFKYRFKGALDCQVISLLAILLMLLFNAEFIRFIGVILSVVYLFIAMASIIRIEVQKSPFRNNEKEE